MEKKEAGQIYYIQLSKSVKKKRKKKKPKVKAVAIKTCSQNHLETCQN